jgi:hypothetical protein
MTFLSILALGFQALYSNTFGEANTVNGLQALYSNTLGSQSTATGYLALNGNTTGNSNTATGAQALVSNVTGSQNTATGFGALAGNSSGNMNTAFGHSAGVNVTTADNVICIGASGQNVSNSCYIDNIYGQTSVSGLPVLINSANKLGTTTSSKRFKEDIKPMDKASEALFALKPVCFRYKKEIDPVGISQLGLVAEDVEKVNPDLVVRDTEGKPYTVRYDQVNAMLLNEFLKERCKNEEQEATIARQQRQIEALTAGLQKVSAQLEASKATPQSRQQSLKPVGVGAAVRRFYWENLARSWRRKPIVSSAIPRRPHERTNHECQIGRPEALMRCAKNLINSITPPERQNQLTNI